MFSPSRVELVDRAPGVIDGISVFVTSSFDGTIILPQTAAQQPQQVLEENVRNDAASWKALAKETPSATLDDHHLWVERLGAMARTVVAAAALVFALIVVAMGIAVASATRAAVATNREIVEVLHIVGAADHYIATEFQRRFLALGLKGAVVGEGGTYEEALSDVKSAIEFHIETFGSEVLPEESPVLGE